MAIPETLRGGALSEYLAQFALGQVGFVVPVPRQEDQFGVDFIVHPAAKMGENVVPVGSCFAVQVKSNARPLAIDTPDKVRCLDNLPLPFFLCVVDRERLTLALYSTLARLYWMWKWLEPKPFALVPDESPPDGKVLDWDNARVLLGPPASRLCLGELDDSATQEDVRKQFLAEVDPWLSRERQGLAWRAQRIPLVPLLTGRGNGDPPSPIFDGLFEAAHQNMLPQIAQQMANTLNAPRYLLKVMLEQAAPEKGEPTLPLPPDQVGKLRKQHQRIVDCVEGFVTLLG